MNDSLRAGSTAWLSFSKAKILSRKYSLLLFDKKLVELSQQNCETIFEGCSIILIQKELGKFRMAFENGDALPVRKSSGSVQVDEEMDELPLPPP